MIEVPYKCHGLGAIRDPYDPRDYIYEIPAGASTYPIGFQLEKMPVKNQGIVNSCVAHSIALIKETQEFYETGKKLQFSVGWIYGYRKQGQYLGMGMYPKEALSNLREWGNVEISDFPENFEYALLQNLVNQRKETCLSKGKKWKISSYARVTTSSAVKSCLFDKHSPVMIIVNIYDSFYNTGANGIVPLKSGALQGSHAMTIIGWTQINGVEYYVVQNSWGANWGDNGVCYIRTNNDIITDMFTIVDKPNDTISFKDVEAGRWSKDAIDKCVKAGLINGFPDGTFRPTNTISREQICQMFANMLNK